MHVALQTSDILHEIFECVSPSLLCDIKPEGAPVHRDRKSLHECALVCKAFSEPALQRLWMHVSTFDALLALLPSSAKVVLETVVPEEADSRPQDELYADINSIWIMEGPVAEADRVRFTWYARHIRTLHMDIARRIDPTVFEHLARAGLGSPLLPRLHTLRGSWTAFYGRLGPHWHGAAVALLGSPALRSLYTAFPDLCVPTAAADDKAAHRREIAPIIRNTIAHVATSAPGLENLTVLYIPYMALLEPVGALHSLRRLDLGLLFRPFDVGFLRALATLVRLEELILSDNFVAQDATLCSGFQSLQKLSIRSRVGPFTVPDLFAALPDLRLKELHIDGMVRGHVEQIHALVESLFYRHGQCLETLALQKFGYDTEARSALATIAPLYALHGIRRFALHSLQPLMIVDEDLRRMGCAWPKLEWLHMSRKGVQTNGVKEVVAPTIEGIVELANTCRGLEGAHFPAVIPAIVPGNVVPPIDLETQKIREIAHDVRIADERVGDVEQATKVLYMVVGKLLVPGLNRDQYRRWSAVLDGLARLS